MGCGGARKPAAAIVIRADARRMFFFSLKCVIRPHTPHRARVANATGGAIVAPGLVDAASTFAPAPPRCSLACVRHCRLGKRVPESANSWGSGGREGWAAGARTCLRRTAARARRESRRSDQRACAARSGSAAACCTRPRMTARPRPPRPPARRCSGCTQFSTLDDRRFAGSRPEFIGPAPGRHAGAARRRRSAPARGSRTGGRLRRPPRTPRSRG